LPVRAQLVVGPAGIGKTALAQHVVSLFPDRSVVSVIALTELAGVPLGAFAPALAQLGLPNDPNLAVGALMATVGRAAERHLLVVDDAPRLDDLSAAAVYQLVRAFGVPTIATARLGESMPQPLARLLDEGLAVKHTLEGLNEAEIDQVLEQHFGARARHSDVVRLAQRTEGNPLYLRVLVESAANEGAVRRRGEIVEIDEGPTPPGLLASIIEAIAALGDAERRMLRLVALTQPADSGEHGIGRFGKPSLDTLMMHGLVVTEPSTRLLRVAHPLVTEAISADSTTDVALADAVAWLLSTGERGHRFAAIRLQCDWGLEPTAPDVVWAAEHAYSVGDIASAISLAGTALSLAGEPELRFQAALTLATAQSTAGELDAADAAFAEAAGHASASGDKVLLAGRRGEHLAFRRFDVAGAVAQAEAVQTQLPREFASSLDADLRLWRAILGETHQRDADLSAAEAHPAATVRSAMAAIMTESMGGRSSAAREASETLERVREKLGALDPIAAAMMGFNEYIERLSLGDHEHALEFAHSRRADSGDGVGLWTVTVAEHLSYNGALTQASRAAALAVDQCRWRDGMGVLALALAIEADTTAKRGDLAGARRILDSMEPAQRNEPKAIMMIAECEAWLAQAEGDPRRAAAIIEHAAQAAAAVGFRLVAAISLGVCIRLGKVERAAGMLEELCTQVPAEFGLYTALRDVAVSLRDKDPAAMPGAAARLVRAGMAPTALDAITLARKMRRSPEVERRLGAVEVMASAGVDAPLLQRREAALLTPKELEVALAAASRERSREIAERLEVSVRTVDNQLQSVYRKLGVGSRDELREALIETGLGSPRQ
jgi:DNA-binding CsgD family transcriptional regulator